MRYIEFNEDERLELFYKDKFSLLDSYNMPVAMIPVGGQSIEDFQTLKRNFEDKRIRDVSFMGFVKVRELKDKEVFGCIKSPIVFGFILGDYIKTGRALV